MASSYNCADATNSSYGASSYGTCTTSQSVGAPNTGLFNEFIGGGSFTILIPLIAAIIIVVIATFVVRRRQTSRQEATVESPLPSHDE